LFDIQKVSTKPSILPCAASRWGMAIWNPNCVLITMETVYLTFMDLLCFLIPTEPDITEEQMKLFHKWEGITLTIFLVEYMVCLLLK
jgi:hypothetical protein